MFKIHQTSTPVPNKPPAQIAKSKKTNSPQNIPVALIQACSINLESKLIMVGLSQRMKYNVSLKRQRTQTVPHHFTDQDTMHSESEVTASMDLLKQNHDNHQLHPLHCYYQTEDLFTLALKLFNKQVEFPYQSSTVSQRWESKGKVRVSLQLCGLCKDMGKQSRRVMNITWM